MHQSSGTEAADSQIHHSEQCMVCGSALEYLQYALDLRCSYCGSIESGHIRCPNEHYICNKCHDKDAMTIIRHVMSSTQSTDPFEIAELMMSYPGLPMLGCLHAYIAAGALMSAIRNQCSRAISDDEIEEVFSRTQKQAYGGYCGLTGICGIVPAIGACFAVLTGSKCGKNEEQRITMEAVSRVTKAIAKLTGPSCCRAYVRISLQAAVARLRKDLMIVLPFRRKIRCKDMLRHPHGCRETGCPYFSSTLLQDRVRQQH